MTSPETTLEEAAEELPISEADLVAGLEYPFTGFGVGEAFERLVLQLEDKFADYDWIISDEASARLVTLTLQDIVNKKRQEERGGFTPKICIAGGQKTDNKKEVEKVLHQKAVHGRILVITELIGSGNSISWLLEILKNLDIDFDVATLPSAYSIKKGMHEWPEPLKNAAMANRLYCGQIGGIGSFYAQDNISGVVKDRNSKSPFPRKSKTADPEKVIRSHKDAAILAGRLYEIIKKEKK